MSEPIEPIPGQQARAILNAAIRARVGDSWGGEDDEWAVVTGHDYMARLTNGRINLDFYVDLLGNVTTEEKPITDVQASGRLYALLFLGLSIVIAFLLARIAGII